MRRPTSTGAPNAWRAIQTGMVAPASSALESSHTRQAEPWVFLPHLPATCGVCCGKGGRAGGTCPVSTCLDSGVPAQIVATLYSSVCFLFLVYSSC